MKKSNILTALLLFSLFITCDVVFGVELKDATTALNSQAKSVFDFIKAILQIALAISFVYMVMQILSKSGDPKNAAVTFGVLLLCVGLFSVLFT